MLKNQFGTEDNDLYIEKIKLEDATLSDGNFYIATQLIDSNNKVGVTFEEQFIIENTTLIKSLITSGKSDTIKKFIDSDKCKFMVSTMSYKITDVASYSSFLSEYISNSKQKTSFAFDIVKNIDDIVIPMYISKGIEWLMSEETNGG